MKARGISVVATQHFDDAEDAELVAAIGRGDDAAMAVIMRRHREPVVAFARRLVGDRAHAEEVGQEVFVRLWERFDRYDRSRGTLRAFLLAMTHGHALMRCASIVRGLGGKSAKQSVRSTPRTAPTLPWSRERSPMLSGAPSRIFLKPNAAP